MNDELYHHGIKGQKWGVRRFQNEDGTLTSRGKQKRKEHNQSKSNNEIKSLFRASKKETIVNDGDKNVRMDLSTYSKWFEGDASKQRVISNLPGMDPKSKVIIKRDHGGVWDIQSDKKLTKTQLSTINKLIPRAERSYMKAKAQEYAEYGLDTLKSMVGAWKSGYRDSD